MCCFFKWLVGLGLRIILVVVNFPILLSGMALLATGIVLVKFGDATNSEAEGLVIGTALLIGFGSILTIIGFSGVCGAFCNTKFLIKLYAVLQAVMFVISIVLLVFTPRFADRIEERWYNEVTTQYGDEDYADVTERWDSLQKSLQCCGYNNYTDYHDSYFENNNSYNYTVPLSCCKKNLENYELCINEAKLVDLTNSTALNKEGCGYIITTFEIIIIAFLSPTLLLLIINAIVACCLMKMNKTEPDSDKD